MDSFYVFKIILVLCFQKNTHYLIAKPVSIRSRLGFFKSNPERIETGFRYYIFFK